MPKNRYVKSILSTLAVAGFGFIILNIAFLFDFLFQILIRNLLRSFMGVDLTTDRWFPPLMHGLFVVVIIIISWFVFQTSLRTLFKAIYMTVPLAAIFVTLGTFFYQTPKVVYLSGSLFGAALLYYLYRTRKPWLYYYTLALVSLVLLIVSLLHIEI